MMDMMKDMMHRKRSQGKTRHSFPFKRHIRMTMPKDVFLSNPANKQRFIMNLENLQKMGCSVVQAVVDADFNIVHTAVQSATEKITVLVCSDTDLVLFCHHVKMKA